MKREFVRGHATAPKQQPSGGVGAKDVASSGIATTDALSPQSLDHLAAMAERENKCTERGGMDPKDRQRFDDRMTDAFDHWHRRPENFAQKNRIKNLERLGADARAVAKRISGVFADDIALHDGLEEAIKLMFRHSIGSRPVHDEDDGKTICGRLYAVRDRLLILTEICEITVKSKLLPQPARQRPKTDGTFEVFIDALAQAWTIGSGKKATTNYDRKSRQRVGPFVEFSRTAMRLIDPRARINQAFGEKVHRALRRVRR